MNLIKLHYIYARVSNVSIFLLSVILCPVLINVYLVSDSLMAPSHYMINIYKLNIGSKGIVSPLIGYHGRGG